MSYSLAAYDPVEVARNFKSPGGNNCYGYLNTDSTGYYLATTKLECGLTYVGNAVMEDEVLPGIVSYDSAQKNGAYIGQINAIAVSSFTGPRSGVWGYDFARSPDLRRKRLYDFRKLKFGKKEITLPNVVDVYDIEPLMNATKALFGNAENRKGWFPPLPGAHVTAAAKSANSQLDQYGRPIAGYVWSYMALAIAKDRANDSSLFVEDCGYYPLPEQDDAIITKYLDDKRLKVVESVLLCGHNQKVEYKEIFTGYVFKYCPPKYYGTAIAYAPYVLLASGAYPAATPDQTSEQRLTTMNLDEWITEMKEKNPKRKK